MSILTGPEIKRRVEAGDIEIDPFRPEHVNPASVDLTLGDTACEYFDDPHSTEKTAGASYGRPKPHDVKKEARTFTYKADNHFSIVPGRLYLLHTVERVCSKSLVSELTGKSSIARLGVVVHLTAGFGDPNFRGQYTLEVTSVRHVLLYPGMRICQMIFHEVVGELESYQERGHYVGDAARGPVPSMVHRQFGNR